MLSFLPTPRRRLDYLRKLLMVSGVPPIGYWPLSEPAGSVALDASGAGRHGAYTACTLNKAGKGDGATGIALDGSTSFVNVFSSSLQSAFNGAEGTVALWAQLPSGVWADATTRRAFTFRADASNFVTIQRTTTNNQLQFLYDAAATQSSISFTTSAPAGPTAWIQLAITWSKSGDAVKAYFNGVQVGTTQTGLGTFAGTLTSNVAVLGALSTSATNPWSGNLQDVAVWPLALPPGAIAELYATGLSGL